MSYSLEVNSYRCISSLYFKAVLGYASKRRPRFRIHCRKNAAGYSIFSARFNFELSLKTIKFPHPYYQCKFFSADLKILTIASTLNLIKINVCCPYLCRKIYAFCLFFRQEITLQRTLNSNTA